ncbi:MAG: phosphoribosylglycinamide synthetase C domain-containing protein, partial [Gemmatimonadaceae bacterium]
LGAALGAGPGAGPGVDAGPGGGGGGRNALDHLRWRDGYAVTTVVAAAGYPASPRLGDSVTLPLTERGVHVFHSGTRRTDGGGLVTAGGRVFSVTAVATDLAQARELSRSAAEAIEFEGRQFRPDIGWRESARLERPRLESRPRGNDSAGQGAAGVPVILSEDGFPRSQE